MRHPFRRKNLSPRLLPFYALAVVAYVLSEPTPSRFAAGFVFVAAGIALRIWGAGHLVKTRRLTVAGPYAHLRHPLYAGTLLLGIGFAWIAGPWGALLGGAVFLPVFFFYYLPYKERVEGDRLLERYGECYRAYRAAVPALIPRVRAWVPPVGTGVDGGATWRSARVFANDELGTLLGVLVALGLLALRPMG